LHNAGFTTSDGVYEVVEVERALRKKGKKSDGYCFYHEQDLGSAIVPQNPSLMLAFQKVDNSDNKTTIQVGKKIVAILKENGFQIKWDEIATRKIEIINFIIGKSYMTKQAKIY